MRELDCRNLNCPEPVLRTKKALEENRSSLSVIVDNAAARENVMRFVKSRGLNADWKDEGGNFVVLVTPAEPQGVAAAQTGEDAAGALLPSGQVILIASNQLGQGGAELGSLLMRNFIYTLTRLDRPPRALVFMNSGVRLCATGSAVLEELGLLQSKGVEILACGTCLDYYGIKDDLRTGTVSNIYEITERLLSAAVLTL